MTPSLITWKTPHGSAVILPERGRLLALETAGHQAFWSPTTDGASWNLGGERLWIAPESDWFWKRTDSSDPANHEVPPALNPDIWTVIGSGETSCQLERKLELTCAHRQTFVSLRLRRTFELRPYPGVTLHAETTIEILDGSLGQVVGLWSILQVPPGGEVLLPVSGVPAPRDYFDPCPAEAKTSSPGVFRLRLSGNSIFKVGLSPVQSVGRMAYVRPVPSGSLVMIRRFPVSPELRYADAPLNALGTQGDATQFFNDGGNFGSFGEVEHHAPALRCGIGPQSFTESTLTSLALVTTADYPDWESQFLTDPRPDQP